MAFRFRQFTIEDEQSTLRVGTDAMLLGSWALPGTAANILDIGTGCGVLALMMAQKSEALIEAVEIDESSVLEAGKNFLKSPWPSRISVCHESLQVFSSRRDSKYDFIITNPPYFSNDLKSPSARINLARHDESLTLTELVGSVKNLLTGDGRFALILPSETAGRFQLLCSENGLHVSRRLSVCPKPSVPPKRILMEFRKTKAVHPENSQITLLTATGKFTPEYLALTGCFHNF
jgi:tRNA1Val (adenine37-N6)-methyltransferase